MKLDRDTLKALDRWAKPFVTRIANTIARGVVQLASDDKKLQLLQIGALAGETIDDAEHFQQYGFSSIPLEGAEVVMVFPNGDRSHPLVIATGDRSSRPTGGKPGEVTMYNKAGASMTMTADGDIIARPATGRSMQVDDGSGATGLPTMADFNGIISIMNAAGVGAGTALPAAVTSYQGSHPGWPFGTKVLKGK